MSHPHYPFILIDGSSYFYRAFHALPPLTNSKGQPTGAVYGVLNMIRKLINDHQPQYLAVVFDAKGKTFRDDMYSEYKANRPPMPDDLRVQYQPLVNIISAMGIPLLCVPGVEADDVIGTLAHRANQAKLPLLISTGDKDMAQLVNEHTTLINTMSGYYLDPTTVVTKFGVTPEQIIDYLTLIGDKVDNIPGVDKVGPKTAVKWLDTYGNLENIIANADKISGKVGENLRSSLQYLPLSQSLIQIKLDVAIAEQPTDLIAKQPDDEQLIKHYQQLEFKNWLNELLNKTSQTEQVKNHYEIIDTEADLTRWLDKLKQADYFSFDTETTNLNNLNAEIVGVSFAVEPNNAAYIPLAHDYENAPKQLAREFVLNQLKPILENEKIKKVGQNLKYDMGVLDNYGIQINGILGDTMLESYVLNSAGNRHDMDTLALKYLGKNTIHFQDIAGKGKSQLTFNQITIENAAPYAAEDADITLQLHQTLFPKIQASSGLTYILSEIEIPLSKVLSKIERTGVLIDAEALMTQSKAFAIRIDALQKQCYQLAGETFNISSPKQLQAILYEKLNLPILKKTPKGQPSTAEAVLSELAFDYPLPNIILEYRSLTKLKSTYLDALPHYIHPKTGRVHTSYNQAVAATGRLSSTDPNLQNIPVKTDAGRKIRSAFIAPKGYKILAADYSQVELRIMAHLSNDSGLLKAFHNGWDIHSATAAEVFNVPLQEVTPELRRRSKAINFGLIYGMSSFGLARQIGSTREEAQQYIDTYFHRYPGVKDYMEKTRAHAHEQGYVETLFGRRLYLPEINAQNLMRQKAAERTAINAPMQGTAADIIKLAMLNIDRYLQQQNSLDAKMIMQVHDELVFEVAEKDVDELSRVVKKLMCNDEILPLKLQVEIGVGDNWQEAH